MTGSVARRVLASTLAALGGAALALGAGPAERSATAEASARTAAHSGEVLVRFNAQSEPDDRRAARRRVGGRLERTLPVRGLQLLELAAGERVSAAVDALERSPGVAYAEPNFPRHATLTPNDTYFGELWGMQSIDAPEAWDLTVGGPATTVAVIDTGVDQEHPDLAGNTWRNPGETGDGREANGLDDDGNGHIDDWRGWDWVASDNDPADEHGHGTHVAGTATARGNDGAGVAGVSWQSRLMAQRVLGADGSGTVADVVEAYAYAARAGAQVVNASLGGPDLSRAEADAIAAAPGTLFVVAAGNGGDDGIGDDNDSVPEYPCSHPAPNVLCVAASRSDDTLAPFSNYGVASVDIAAPGTSILSSRPGARFAFSSGTSMATPHVAGAAALLWSLRPAATPAEVKRALLDSADTRDSLAGRVASGGRLNVRAALDLLSGGLSSEPSAEPPPNSDGSPEQLPESAPVAPPAEPDLTRVVPDVTPPETFVALRHGRTAAAVARNGLRVRIRCSEGCALAVVARVPDARRAGAVVAARRTTALDSAGATRLRLRLSRAGARRLRRARRPLVVVRVRARDAVGNVGTVTRRLRLSR